MSNRIQCAFLVLVVCCLGTSGCSAEDEESPWIVNSGIWGLSQDDIYISGYVSGCGCEEKGFVKHYNGTSWSTVYEDPGGYLWGIWGASADELFAVSDRGLLHIENGSSAIVESDALSGSYLLEGVHGSAPDNVFAVGQEGAIAHYDGVSMTAMESGTTARLHDVFAISESEAFAVGENGTILRYDGTAWSPMESGTARVLQAVWGTSSNDLFAVGGSELEAGYIILRYDGSNWSTVQEGGPFNLLDVSGTTADNVYAVGGARIGDGVDAAILHFDGQSWEQISSSAGEFLWSVRTSGPGSYAVVGPNDTKEIFAP